MVPAEFFRRLKRRKTPGRQASARLALLMRHPFVLAVRQQIITAGAF
jgi:hypothetical protein